jgi:hypothetical protein
MANEITRLPRSGVMRSGGVGRANSLGQFDEEFNYGPKPLDRNDVPIDIRERYIKNDALGTPGVMGGGQPSGWSDLGGLIRDVHSLAGTSQLRRGLIGRVVTVTSSPTLIVYQQEVEGRGYLFLNPSGVVGLTAKGTLLSSTNLVGNTTLQTGSLGVANYKTARLFFNVTFNVGAGPVTFNIQTLDPVTGTLWFTSQTESFVATGNRYVDIGDLGVDTDLAVTITVPLGTTITTAIGFVLKDGLEGTSAGVTQTIFLGSAGVTSTAGYPLLAGKEREFFVTENIQLFAVTAGPTLSLNIFEL